MKEKEVEYNSRKKMNEKEEMGRIRKREKPLKSREKKVNTGTEGKTTN